MIEEILERVQSKIESSETIAKAVLCGKGIIVMTVIDSGQFPFHPPYIVDNTGEIGYVDIAGSYGEMLKEGEVAYEDLTLMKRAKMQL